MDREGMERCLGQVAAYQGSGLKAKEWAEVNGVPLKALSSWCAHAQRWRARLDGVSRPTPMPPPKANGFVAARAPATAAATVRVELQVGTTRVELHWPVLHTHELASWLREVGR